MGRATQASMSSLHGPTGAVVPAHRGTVEGRLGTFASHFVKTPALAVSFVAPLLHEAPGVVVSAALALVVDDPSIGKQRPVVLIGGWQGAEGEIVHQHRCCVYRVLWAAAEIDHVGRGHGFFDPNGARRIGAGSDQSAVPCTIAGGDGRRGI